MPSNQGMATLYNSLRFADQYRRSQQPKQSFAFGQSPGSVPYADLAAMVNQFMTQQAVAPYIANLPGYTGLTQQRSANIGSQLAGQVSPSTTNLLAQRGAERGISVGAGGPNAAASWLAALGLTSEGLQQQGQANLSQAIADTPVPEIWNPMSLYVPERLAQQELAAARTGGGGRVTFGSGYGGGGGMFSPTTLAFSAQTSANQNAQRRAMEQANQAYWNSLNKPKATSATGTGSLTTANIFGGFPAFSMGGLY